MSDDHAPTVAVEYVTEAWSLPEVSHELTTAVYALQSMPDADVLHLHRLVSRRAAVIRQRDPEYVRRQRLGYDLYRNRLRAASCQRGGG